MDAMYRTARLYGFFGAFVYRNIGIHLHRTSTCLQDHTTEHGLCTGSFSLTHKTAEPRARRLHRLQNITVFLINMYYIGCQ